jgi:hypothetical protein
MLCSLCPGQPQYRARRPMIISYFALIHDVLALITRIVHISARKILRSTPTTPPDSRDVAQSSAHRQNHSNQRESNLLTSPTHFALRANGVSGMPPKLMLSNRAKYFFPMLYTNQAPSRDLALSGRPLVTIRYDLPCTFRSFCGTRR